MVLDGQADIGVATEALIDTPDIVAFPYYSWHHAVVVPAGHALESAPKLTLETLADYPLITYNEGFTGRGKIDQAFASAGLAPDIVMSALDADGIKSYVELGLGAGIIASMAFEPERDTKGMTGTQTADNDVERIRQLLGKTGDAPTARLQQKDE